MTAIEFDNISKQYRLGLISTGTLSHDLNRLWQTKVLHREDPYLKVGEANDRTSAGSSDYVWALRDIDFKVEEGDVIGIIGRNGAGKSTLLKILSRVTSPTTGVIRARGRIASLLEVGTGFHPEMTGRENIYMNGCIMGMRKAEIDRKLDEIVDFSGCERYLDTPVKRYSSGMTGSPSPRISSRRSSWWTRCWPSATPNSRKRPWARCRTWPIPRGGRSSSSATTWALSGTCAKAAC